VLGHFARPLAGVYSQQVGAGGSAQCEPRLRRGTRYVVWWWPLVADAAWRHMMGEIRNKGTSNGGVYRTHFESVRIAVASSSVQQSNWADANDKLHTAATSRSGVNRECGVLYRGSNKLNQLARHTGGASSVREDDIHGKAC
jgi:hypothetical protein